ncbi:FecR family protein [Pedobacter sp. ok626]|uniref:FecR family protein n=1 Tax=Pedobacter sp. ok626 TaxID=1761882 RepID=UPI00087E43DF|nr:FecR family protein [Pedobacter sp. ok626]SDL01643.1 FecR family protein [Pedobacter sp. ok626]
MNRAEIKDLLAKYKANACTDAELEILESWYLEYENTDLPELSDKEKKADLDEIWKGMPIAHSGARRFRWSHLSVAAIVLIALSVGFFLYKIKDTPSQLAHTKTNDIAPGGNKAILVLADGKRISLTDAPDGTVTHIGGITIVKKSDGRLVYKVMNSGQEQRGELKYNIIETPVGGQFQVDLPDGTRVWLNALSSIKFPASFAGQAFRKVALKGEAYFEVAKNKNQPFRVSTDKQEVEVVGTHFNINAYPDELAVKTTLLEGSVKVNGEFIKPGQQSVVTSTGLRIFKTDLEAALAWKNGLFMFDSEALESVMRKISKWYGVTVKYSNEEVKTLVFGGTVSKFDNVSKVLKMMELTGDVHFKLEGPVITVMP